MRVGFTRTQPDYDPWRYDARRLVESGEADAAVWISALAGALPDWGRVVPTIALVPSETTFPAAPEVAFFVGRPGVDHDAVLFDPELGALAPKRASSPSGSPSVAAVLSRIRGRLPVRAEPC
jgi:formylmethanofuran dehydrogenase subunit B